MKTVIVINAINEGSGSLSDADRRELKRRILEIPSSRSGTL